MVTEDDMYRASTQYRLWNFTPERLAALRQKTNSMAREHVKAALKRKRKSSKKNPGGGASENDDTEADDVEIDFLTVDEERTLIDFFCVNLVTLARHSSFQLPTNVVATAVQFIKRFFITNSVMTYHPREIMTTALFLANKTENLHYSLKTFHEKLSEIPGLDKITADEIVAPEFILTQGLRFCFDVRHPHRALKGLYLELQSLLRVAAGEPPPDAWRAVAVGDAAADVRKRLLGPHGTAAALSARVEAAQHEAREMLQRPAMLSDAYFLFTPAQVALAALRAADAALVEGLLATKFALRPAEPGDGGGGGAAGARQRPGLERVLEEVDRCAALLRAAEFDDAQLKRDALKVDRKLHYCRHPEKLDLVGLNRARKRDAGEDAKPEDKLAKKRRLEKERREREGDDPFGPSLAAKSGR